MSETRKAGDGMPDIGELNIGEVDSADQTGSAGASDLEQFEVKVEADFARKPARDPLAIDVDVLEGTSASVDDDGSIVADIVSVTMDEDSGYAVIEEVVGVVTADGTEISEQTFSVLDPEGNLSVLTDDAAVEEDARS